MKISTNVVLEQAPVNVEKQAVPGESEKQIIGKGGCEIPLGGKDYIDRSGGKSYGFVYSGEAVTTSNTAASSKDAAEMEKQLQLGKLKQPTFNSMPDGGIRIPTTPHRVGVIHTQGASIPKKPVNAPPKPQDKMAIDNSTELSEPNRRIIENGGCVLPLRPEIESKGLKVDGGANSGQKTDTHGSSNAVHGRGTATTEDRATLFGVVPLVPMAARDPFHSTKIPKTLTEFRGFIRQGESLWHQMMGQRLRELADFRRHVPRWNGERMLNGYQNFLNHSEQVANRLGQAKNALEQMLRSAPTPEDVRQINRIRRTIQFYGATLERLNNVVELEVSKYSAEHARKVRAAARAARTAINAGRTAQEGLQAFRAAEQTRAAGIAAGEAELAAAAKAEQLAVRAARLRMALRMLGGFVLMTAATEAVIWGSEAMKEAAKIKLSAVEREYAQGVINQALLENLVQPFEIENLSYPEALVYISAVRQALVDFEIEQKNAAQNVPTPQNIETPQQQNECVEEDEKK